MQKSISLLRRDSVQELFHEYYFDEQVAMAILQSNQYYQGTHMQSSRNNQGTNHQVTAATTTVIVNK
jgi:hypothetical protein